MFSIDLILTGTVVFLAYLVRGISGFGSALVAVPLLVHLLPLTFVVPFIAVMDVTAALILTGAGQRSGQVRWSEIRWLIPGSLLGVVVGLKLLISLDSAVLLAALGLFVMAFGLRNLFGLQGKRKVSRWWSLPAGVIGGGIGAVFAAGGPPYVIYLSHRLHDTGALRSTMSAIFLLDGGLRISGLLLAGLLLQSGLGVYLLAGLPLMAAGLYAGNHIHLGLSQRQMTVIVALLLLASGSSLLYRFWLPG